MWSHSLVGLQLTSCLIALSLISILLLLIFNFVFVFRFCVIICMLLSFGTNRFMCLHSQVLCAVDDQRRGVLLPREPGLPVLRLHQHQGGAAFRLRLPEASAAAVWCPDAEQGDTLVLTGTHQAHTFYNPILLHRVVLFADGADLFLLFLIRTQVYFLCKYSETLSFQTHQKKICRFSCFWQWQFIHFRASK